MATPTNPRPRQPFTAFPGYQPPSYKPPSPAPGFLANPQPEVAGPMPTQAASMTPGPGGLVQLLPQQMFQERPSLMVERLTGVSDRIDLYDAEARRILEKTGVHGQPHLVTKPANETILMVLQMVAQPMESFQLTRGAQGWGIYHIETPSMLGVSRGVTETKKHLKACPIETKRMFLRHAREIFTAYIKQVGSLFQGIDQELNDADNLLQELRQIP